MRQTKYVSVYFNKYDIDLYERLEKLAKVKNITMAELIRNILRKYLKKEETQLQRIIINALEEKKKALD